MSQTQNVLNPEDNFDNYHSFQERIDFINKETAKLVEMQNSLTKNFTQAIANNDLLTIKKLIDWGIADYANLYSDKEIFKTNLSISFNNSSRNGGANTISKEVRDYFLLESPLKMRNIVLKSFIDNTYNNLTRYTNNSYYIANHYFIDDLQWLYEHQNSIFESKFAQKVINSWGNLSFDCVRHSALHQYVLERHPNLLDVILKISSKQSKEDLLPENQYPSLEDLYSVSQYQKIIDKLPRHEMLLKGSKCLESAITVGNKTNINFWLSFYIPLPESKKCFADFIQQCHKNNNFFNTLEFIIENSNITMHNHMLLRSALPHGHDDTVKFLLSKYNNTQLQNIKEIFNDPKYIKYKDLYSNTVKSMISYNTLKVELNNVPEKAAVRKHKV